MRYPHTVTFEEPVKDQLPSGQETRAYVAVTGLTDLPARIVPVQEEEQETRMVVDTDRFTLILQGDYAIERPMRAVTDFLDGILDVIKVERPVLYRSAATYATLVTAERVYAAVDGGVS